eukprot:TRINITY_DN14891_c0_g1_i1.p1 TRINITY_DN14891_c0_g1~~TRINITY_DN14891_c0_g1_i1.p1  ORF type:complete len:519 (+),score=102.17 TRINITY_DN14891_c0_g1_i1:85-1641(+)
MQGGPTMPDCGACESPYSRDEGDPPEPAESSETGLPCQAAGGMGHSAKRLLWNCTLMSVCFAWAEGAVAAILAVSASLIDRDLNATAGLVLYGFFAAGSLVAPAVTARLGLKQSLVAGLVGFSMFTASFVHPVAEVMYPAAAFSGVMGAVLWTAQGSYFTINALEYTAALEREGKVVASSPSEADRSPRSATSCTLKSVEEQNRHSIGIMSGVFATVFPLALTTCKLLSSLVQQWDSQHAVELIYSIYTTLAVVSAAGMGCILPMDASRYLTSTQRFASLWDDLTATVAVLRDRRLLLLIPANAIFGLAAGYFPVMMTPLAADTHGKQHVGYLYAVAGAASFVLASVYSWMSSRIPLGRVGVMLWGALQYILLFAALVWWTPTSLAGLYGLWILYGSANTVWQGTCMALFADYWQATPTAAFANLKLHSGVASFVAYALFPRHGSLKTNALWCFAVACVSFVGIIGAALSHRRREAEAQQAAADVRAPAGDVATPSLEEVGGALLIPGWQALLLPAHV